MEFAAFYTVKHITGTNMKLDYDINDKISYKSIIQPISFELSVVSYGIITNNIPKIASQKQEATEIPKYKIVTVVSFCIFSK